MTPIPSTGPRPRTDEPRTEAGRCHVEDWWPVVEGRNSIERQDAEREVAAIEAEARAQTLAAVEEAVRAMETDVDQAVVTTIDAPRWVVDRAAVLAVLAKLQEDEQ